MSKAAKKRYTHVTANINKDGSPMIVAWINSREFDIIPLSDGKGGQITRIAPVAWRDLKVGEAIQEGDQFYNTCTGEWKPWGEVQPGEAVNEHHTRIRRLVPRS